MSIFLLHVRKPVHERERQETIIFSLKTPVPPCKRG